MTSWLRRTIVVTALLGWGSVSFGQPPDGTMVFSRIANWQIARANWPAYEDNLKKNTLPVLEKMLADGVITEYGLGSAAVHTADGYTHSTWFSSRTIAGLEQCLAAIVAVGEKLPAAERRRADTDFVGTKHLDLLVRSRVVRGRTTRLTSGFAYVSTDVVQPGKIAAYNERYEKNVRPSLDALFSSGAITSYGIDQEFIHTNNPNGRTRWIIVPAADGLDKFTEAQATANQARTPAERQALAQASREILDGASHRDELWQLSAYASKY